MIIAGYHVKKYFQAGGMLSRGGPTVKAVDDVTIAVGDGKIVGVVGESGSGKTTLGRLLVRLIEPTAGEVLFDVPDDELKLYSNALETGDRDTADKIAGRYSLMRKSHSELRAMRRYINMVFQDPYSSLDPRLRVMDIVMEPMVSTGFMRGEAARKRVMDLLEEVGLPRNFAFRYPHELSGGQRQRVALARAIATNPKFIVLDEPTSALDVSVQAQILKLLRELKERHGISMLLITHNIAVVSYLADDIYVMYAGKIMEHGAKNEVIHNPKHPYTIALISSVPVLGRKMSRVMLKGDPPNLVNPPKGCHFHTRCPVAFNECGWTADELINDLTYLVQGKYYEEFGDSIAIEQVDELTIRVKGADPSKLRSMLDAEEGSILSIKGISEMETRDDEVIIHMARYSTPTLYEFENREIACLLFRPTKQVSQSKDQPA